MIILNLTPSDLVDMRFAYSPLLEISLSRRMMLRAQPQMGYGRWLDEAYRALHGIELPYLDALVEPPRYIVDFLTPTPVTTGQSLEDELANLRCTDPVVVCAHVRRLLEYHQLTYDKTEVYLPRMDILREYLVQPAASIDCLIEELRLYWTLTLSHHWPRLTAILDGDVLHRARQMALKGAESVLSDLHPNVFYEGGKIILYKGQRRNLKAEYDLDGKGLQLVPIMFAAEHFYWQVSEPYQPMLIYGPRGLGNWSGNPAPSNQSLEVALGTGRARILQSLRTPANTGEMATRLQVTAGAVSQHLSKLREAGLVEPHRSGRRVYYHLTERGEQLLTLFKS